MVLAVSAPTDREARLSGWSTGPRTSRPVAAIPPSPHKGGVRSAPVELSHEGRRLLGIGQNQNLAYGTREGHVEDATFPFLVVTQPVWEEALGNAVDNDVLPFTALDLVDRREMDRRSFGGSSPESSPKPRLEGGDVRMERRQ